ncbi:hypothetical protein SAMN04489844_1923 [Nocardioides exalbidus]|uniref:AAA+ ATPase domain-containing protein n=2 Tax=Nocardioides exalbidus TaxID=402596 RepID=A0A1H4QUU4_9ACTN|nr:hypothetical protein SAMN04489844_1923 [Nocardioides exalbidus]
MPLFRASVTGVRAQIAANTLVPTMSEQFAHAYGYRASIAEQRSWERSLTVLTGDLHDAGLDKVEVLLEYQLPLTSRRVDALLCGTHPRTGEASYVVVELKQWSSAAPVDGTDDVVLDDGRGRRLHPAAQVGGYCDYLADFNAALGGSTDRLAGVAYLHNADDDGVSGLWDFEQSRTRRMFTGQRRGEFLDFLKGRLSTIPGADAADALLGAAIKPSKQLLDLAAQEIKEREQFVLLDEQQVAYSMILRAVEHARRANTKEVVVVTGGPGSGKSVIALSLLGELSRQGRSVLHATGSSAFTQTLRKVAGHREPRVKALFSYYNNFVDADKNGLDVLINDEAHRIRETSTNRWTPAAKRSGRPQVEDLIDAARVSVFLLDEHQVVKPGERGNVADIVAAAGRLGCEVVQIDLDDQFRCGGSRLYEEWVMRLLGLEPGGPMAWPGDEVFDLDLAESPGEMELRLRARLDRGFSSRIAAGYCWSWSKPKGDILFPDVQIGDWKRPWNNPKDTKVGAAPGRPFWASDPAGFEQVGCVYTAQGFEYDYSGVIFGDDLVWRTDRWEARPDRSKDNQVRRAAPDDFDRAIRNTYKVLLTRGMRGTLVYSTDAETQDFLASLIHV